MAAAAGLHGPAADVGHLVPRSPTCRYYSRLGLIDEYRLVILPVAVGSGLPLFKDLAKPLRVDLAEAKSFPDGTVIHVYRPSKITG
jgi:dihydrofolate reductase